MASFVFLLVSLFLPHLYRVAVVVVMGVVAMGVVAMGVTNDAGWSFVWYMSSGANTNSVGT